MHLPVGSLSEPLGCALPPAGFKPIAGSRWWQRELRRTQEGQMARTKSNSKATARRKAPIARSRTGSSGSAKAVSETPSNSVNAGRTRGTKQDLIIGLLQREEGATLGQLVEATGWLPHTTRAALTRACARAATTSRRRSAIRARPSTGSLPRLAWPARARPRDMPANDSQTAAIDNEIAPPAVTRGPYGGGPP